MYCTVQHYSGIQQNYPLSKNNPKLFTGISTTILLPVWVNWNLRHILNSIRNLAFCPSSHAYLQFSDSCWIDNFVDPVGHLVLEHKHNHRHFLEDKYLTETANIVRQQQTTTLAAFFLPSRPASWLVYFFSPFIALTARGMNENLKIVSTRRQKQCLEPIACY